MAPALSQTNIEIVPGGLPWMSSCPGPVTIASAMSGTVSDTRVIAAPTLRMADRPTSRSISVGISAAARGAPGAVALTGTNAGACCRASGAATRITMMKPARAAHETLGARDH